MENHETHNGNGPSFGAAYGRDKPLKIRRRSYRRFSRWMDKKLAELVERWEHTAAPNAQLAQRSRFRKVKPK